MASIPSAFHHRRLSAGTRCNAHWPGVLSLACQTQAKYGVARASGRPPRCGASRQRENELGTEMPSDFSFGTHSHDSSTRHFLHQLRIFVPAALVANGEMAELSGPISPTWLAIPQEKARTQFVPDRWRTFIRHSMFLAAATPRRPRSDPCPCP